MVLNNPKKTQYVVTALWYDDNVLQPIYNVAATLMPQHENNKVAPTLPEHWIEV